MSTNNNPASNNETNFTRQIPSQSQPFSLMNLQNHRQILQEAQSKSQYFNSAFQSDIQSLQNDSIDYNAMFDEPVSVRSSQDFEFSNWEQHSHYEPNQASEQQYNPDYIADQIRNPHQDPQINSELTNGPIHFENIKQMNEEARFEFRQHIQNSPILENSHTYVNQGQQDIMQIRNEQNSQQFGSKIIIQCEIQEISQISEPESQIDIGNKDKRIMNDMMRQTFVALQSSMQNIQFPENYATLESSETEDKIRHMFKVLKLFLEKVKRRCSGRDIIKSIPNKKAAMIIFNLMNLSLNEQIRHIKIPEIQDYLDKCIDFQQGIVNQAKHLFRQEVRKLMSRNWIYQMSLKAKFRRKGKKSLRQFFEKYMQHVAKQLHKDCINPKAFDRDEINQKYTSLIEQNIFE